MPKNYWMVVQSPENFRISKERGFDVHGLTHRQRRRAQRIEPDDRILFYVSGIRKWTATATVTSKYFEDRTPVWQSNGQREEYPLRVHMSPLIVLAEPDYIDALDLGPRLEYVKRWAPEQWPLAFVETLHILPQRDYRLIEGEMKRVKSKRRRRRDRGQRRDRSQRQDGKRTSAERDEAVSEPEAITPTVENEVTSEAEARTGQRQPDEIDTAPGAQAIRHSGEGRNPADPLEVASESEAAQIEPEEVGVAPEPQPIRHSGESRNPADPNDVASEAEVAQVELEEIDVAPEPQAVEASDEPVADEPVASTETAENHSASDASATDST